MNQRCRLGLTGIKKLPKQTGWSEFKRTRVRAVSIKSMIGRECSADYEETNKIPIAAHFTACSKSASSKMMLGLFPPSSSVTTLRLDLADASWILRPVSVLPVNAIFLISGCNDIAAPAVAPRGTVRLTPRTHMSEMQLAVSGNDVYDTYEHCLAYRWINMVVDRTRRETSFLYQASEFQGGKGRYFGWL